jgi:hypothetical protein
MARWSMLDHRLAAIASIGVNSEELAPNGQLQTLWKAATVPGG